MGSYVPVKEMSVNKSNDTWSKSYLNCGKEMKMKKWSSQWTQFMQFIYDLFHIIYHLYSFFSREHMNPQFTCSQRQWLDSSVGRATHRYREVTGSNPFEVLNFFQASFRNCINCVHCDDHFFIFISFPQFIYDLFHVQ